ncbi:MAG: acyltransferase [Verrucomicrobia bacterium]|nr:acyltransferase [Verrucomicrobiota bacterium]
MISQKTEAANTSARSGEHILFLDHIRGIAIFLVVMYHLLVASHGMDLLLSWNGWIRDFSTIPISIFLLPFTAGWLGVAIFFVVSGFCIHLSHEKAQQPGLKAFFVRRFFRIYPPYVLALCFFALLFAPTKLRFDSFQDFVQLGSHIFLINNTSKELFYGINGSFWSVVVEAQLYLIYPLLLLIVRRFGWGKALWFTGLLEVSLRAGCAVPIPDWLSCSPFFYWFSWSVGAKLADDYLKGRPLFLASSPLWLWPTVTCIAYFFRPSTLFVFLFAALATAKWISHLLSRPVFQPEQRSPLYRFFQWLGIISYSLYLVHEPFLTAFIKKFTLASGEFSIQPPLFALYILCFGGVILMMAWLFHRLVELPSIAMGKQFWKRPTLASPSKTI